MSFDYEDEYELYTDTFAKDYKTPQQVQSHLFNEVYNRDYKLYLNSIEWDSSWLKHDTPEEASERRRILNERKQQIEMENSPFAKWF
jgi:hypothetical protein